MQIGLYGTGGATEARRASLERLGHPLAWTGETPSDFAAMPPLGACFVGGPVAERALAAREAAGRGAAVLAEWPPATGLREAYGLVRLGEEAGVEVGVARTLRFHPALEGASSSESGPMRLVVARASVPGASLPAGPALADLLDVCAFLVGTHGLRRVEAQAVRGRLREPRAYAFGLRFTSGAYAQGSLVAAGEGAPASLHLSALGAGEPLAADLAHGREAARDRETAAFLAAVASGVAAPVTALDGLHTLRLVERVMARMR